MKWISRILIVAVCVGALFGCQKGQKAAAAKKERSHAGAKASTASAKPAQKSSTSKSTSAKSSGEKSTSSHEKHAAAHTVHPGVLTMADNDRTFNVARGEGITVKLEANHASGFAWALAEELGAVVKQEGKPSYVRHTEKSGKTASGGTEIWHFRAAGAGRETVKMEYRRSWERDIPERTFRFNLTVH